MDDVKFEICQIRYATWTEGAILGYGGARYACWVAEKADESGKIVTVAKTEKYERSDYDYGLSGRGRADHLMLIQKLASKGWEPAGTDQAGTITAMRRRLTPSPDDAKPELTELLKQLASLMEAGLLTPEEFDAKKAEILRRM
jgi:hypothetical protein